MKPYTITGPVDCKVKPDLSVLKGKSVIVTGGASGLGEGYVRAFSTNGAFVTFGDIDETKGKKLAEETGAQFVKVDVANWEHQVQMFKAAKAASPHKSVDIVIANAGIGGRDSLWELQDPDSEPVKPDFPILDVDLIGALYTFKLACHYFRAQPEDSERDRCFIFKGSLSGYVDNIGNWQYAVAKWGLRGLTNNARRSTDQQGIRVNYVAPYYVLSGIRSLETQKYLESHGVQWARSEDCDAAMLRIACDKSIHGHSLSILSREDVAEGFKDNDEDDFAHNPLLKKLQSIMLVAVPKVFSSLLPTREYNS
ncbi:hypothetical protein F5884DRAFT_679109 [Xylogone sp. PMI_703]|nr:hypothetical protein F5884DRAFT_679109 [Xylogone sp. PMI_703]